MITAVIYTRVSTDEQAEKGFSLRDQKSKLERYCTDKGIAIAAHFEDDYSAKTFERPAFQKLLAYLEKNKGKVQKLLVVKFDRFTRNMMLGLNMIAHLQTLKVSLEAIEQPLDIDVPENLLMQAIYLATPQVENQRRSLNTMNGMRRAMKEGRYVSKAPHGYLNRTDENKKPYIVPDPLKAPFIARAFQLISEGSHSQNEVRRIIWKEGFKLSKSRFSAILHNPLYCGQIHIAAYKNEKPETVKGIHEPLVSESLFYKVQDILSGKQRSKAKTHFKVTEELPLRGLLYCNSFDHRMTGSCSHGRNDKYYYYHCENRHHCERHRAESVEKAVIELFESLQLQKDHAEDFRYVIEELTKPEPQIIRGLQTKIQNQQSRLQILQDKFIDGHITLEDYSQIRARYEAALFDLKQELNIIQDSSKDFHDNFGNSMTLLSNLSGFYRNSTANTKREIIGSIITGKLYFAENKCRTANLNPLIELISNGGAAFRAKEVLQLQNIRRNVPPGDPDSTQSRTILLIEGAKKLSQVLKLVA